MPEATALIPAPASNRDLAILADLDTLSVREICSKHHCSNSTISKLRKTQAHIKESITSTKKDLPKKLYEIARLSISAITPLKLASASAPQLITTAAIAIDKARLMEGLSTENMDIRAVVPRIQEQLDNTIKAQAEVIELIRSKGGTYAQAST